MNLSFFKKSLHITLAVCFLSGLVAESVSAQCWTQESYGNWADYSSYDFHGGSYDAVHERYLPPYSRGYSPEADWETEFDSRWDSRFESDWDSRFYSDQAPGCSCSPTPLEEGCQPGDEVKKVGETGLKDAANGSDNRNVGRHERSIIRPINPGRVPTPLTEGSQTRADEYGSETKNRARDVADQFKADDSTMLEGSANSKNGSASKKPVEQPSSGSSAKESANPGMASEPMAKSSSPIAAEAVAELSRFPAVNNIRNSGLTIYDQLHQKQELFIESKELEAILDSSMKGLNLDYKLRTRAKVARQEICKALGYPVPESFKQVRPRFTGQNLDCYVQKSDNLQIWNEDIDDQRRYAIVRLNDDSKVKAVRVLTGRQLYELSQSNKETIKLQAKANRPFQKSTLLSPIDTETVKQAIERPTSRLLPISSIYARLSLLSGRELSYEGNDQERNRGEALHRLVCDRLDTKFNENGRFPDVTEQLLEIKLQTSPTIDLGAIRPDSEKEIIGLPGIKHRDTRFVIFYGTQTGDKVKLTRVVVVNGADFYKHFDGFGGNVVNGKLQVTLPDELFE